LAAHRDEPLQLVEAQLHQRQPGREQPLQRLVPRRALQQRHQQPKRLILSHIHQKDCRDVPHALHVSHLRVVQRVRFEDAEQLALPQAVALAVVDVGGVGARHVADDVHLARRRAGQQLRVRVRVRVRGGVSVRRV
jgi:hypothetical protein